MESPQSRTRNPKCKGKVPKSSSLELPIPVEEIKKEKEDPSTSEYSPRKKIKLSKNPKQNKKEFCSSLPIAVEKIKKEKEDPPVKYPSKKSKRNKLEQERQENYSALPIPVENIKVEEVDPDEIVYMHFHFNPSPISIKIEKEDDDAGIENLDYEKRTTTTIKERKEKTKAEKPVHLDSETKTSKLFPCEIKGGLRCRVALKAADILRKQQQNRQTQCKIPECLKFITPSQLDRHLNTDHSKKFSKVSSKKKKKKKEKIKYKIPETFMQTQLTQTIKYKIPEAFMPSQTIRYKVPEIPTPFPKAVENIKSKKGGSHDIVYMRFNSTLKTDENIKIEEQHDNVNNVEKEVQSTFTLNSEKKLKNQKRKEKTNETDKQSAPLDSQLTTSTLLFPCPIKGYACGMLRTAESLNEHLENVHNQWKIHERKKITRCVIPACLKFVPRSQMNRHLQIEHTEDCELRARNAIHVKLFKL